MTLFVYDFCSRTGITDTQKGDLITVSAFDGVVKKFFPKFEYTHKSSRYLVLGEDGYTPTGFDISGVNFYRLTDISQSDGIYTASFDGFEIAESSFPLQKSDSSIGKNGRAVLEKAGLDYMDDISAIRQTMLEIFLSEDYPNQLHSDLLTEVLYLCILQL